MPHNHCNMLRIRQLFFLCFLQLGAVFAAKANIPVFLIRKDLKGRLDALVTDESFSLPSITPGHKLGEVLGNYLVTEPTGTMKGLLIKDNSENPLLVLGTDRASVATVKQGQGQWIDLYDVIDGKPDFKDLSSLYWNQVFKKLGLVRRIPDFFTVANYSKTGQVELLLNRRDKNSPFTLIPWIPSLIASNKVWQFIPVGDETVGVIAFHDFDSNYFNSFEEDNYKWFEADEFHLARYKNVYPGILNLVRKPEFNKALQQIGVSKDTRALEGGLLADKIEKENTFATINQLLKVNREFAELTKSMLKSPDTRRLQAKDFVLPLVNDTYATAVEISHLSPIRELYRIRRGEADPQASKEKIILAVNATEDYLPHQSTIEVAFRRRKDVFELQKSGEPATITQVDNLAVLKENKGHLINPENIQPCKLILFPVYIYEFRDKVKEILELTFRAAADYDPDYLIIEEYDRQNNSGSTWNSAELAAFYKELIAKYSKNIKRVIICSKQNETSYTALQKVLIGSNQIYSLAQALEMEPEMTMDKTKAGSDKDYAIIESEADLREADLPPIEAE